MLNPHQYPVLARPFQPVVSVHTLTLFLAYVYYYTPSLLPGRRLSPRHLQSLVGWISRSRSRIRSVHMDKPLAAHLALLQGSGLIISSQEGLAVSPFVTTWLHQTLSEQIEPFLALLKNPNRWDQTLFALKLGETLPEDYVCYLQQTLERQIESANNQSAPPVGANATRLPHLAYWVDNTASSEEWQICLPDTLPSWLLFDLLQLGEWQPGSPLLCTPISLLTAVRRGYSPHHIRWLIETATERPFSENRQKELEEWVKRGKAYKVRQVQVLSTTQPGQLKEILAQKRWRPYLQQQISPCHAIIQSDLIPQLQAWLAQKGYVLDEGDDKVIATEGYRRQGDCNQRLQGAREQGSKGTSEVANHWLGLRVLVGFGEIIPLPYPPPYELLESAGKQLTPLQKSELEAIAQVVFERLRTAVRGQDAFWPPQNPTSPERITRINQAIEQEKHLDIYYQSLGEFKPSYRRIQPLRLESQGTLYYLYAYCYRTETNLVFRVDRIHEILEKEWFNLKD